MKKIAKRLLRSVADGIVKLPLVRGLVLRELGRLAGLEVTPHDLRHTFAAWLINEKNESLAVAQKLLGHKRSDTTMRYAKPTWKHLQEAVEKI